MLSAIHQIPAPVKAGPQERNIKYRKFSGKFFHYITFHSIKWLVLKFPMESSNFLKVLVWHKSVTEVWEGGNVFLQIETILATFSKEDKK